MLALPLLIGLLGGAPQTASPCASPEHRQFDFWIGEWEVTLPDGKVAGHNRITKILDGCALKEEWTGAKGNEGTSLNAWDPDARRWRQTWVDQGGTVLLLAGALEAGKMVLQGGGGSGLQRITWTPMPDGRVRQLWESSSDGGRAWKVEFDGNYAKKP
jgi:hypothetical protein